MPHVFAGVSEVQIETGSAAPVSLPAIDLPSTPMDRLPEVPEESPR